MINNISFLNFKSNLRPSLRVLGGNNQANVISFNGANLKPLAHDTVSFTSKTKEGNYIDDEALMSAVHNDEICEQLHNDAQEAKQYLHDTIEKYFKGYIYDKVTNPDGLIEPLQSRVKTAGSIKEKVVKKLAKTLLPQKDPNKRLRPYLTTFNPFSKEGIKENIRDVAGCRIVVKDAFDSTMDTIVDELCTLIREEEMIIEEIENHVPKEEPQEQSSAEENGDNKPKQEKVVPYFTEAQLRKIRQVINEVRLANNLPTIDIKVAYSDAGYMALHLDVDTTNIGRRKDNRGFYTELQILGSDVAMLKDIEDLCYKLKDNKSIKQNHPSFTPFEKFFQEAYTNTEDYPFIVEKYQEYTKKAYQAQRMRRPQGNNASDDTKDWSYTYPTIEECGLKDDIPPILDFNNLARLKRDCEDLLYVYNNPQKVLDDAKKPKEQQ